jgi:hypothetical protein
MIAHTGGIISRGSVSFEVPGTHDCGVFGSFIYFVAGKLVVFVDLTASNETYDFNISIPIQCSCVPSDKCLWLGCEGAIIVFYVPLDSPSTETITFPRHTTIVSLAPLCGGAIVASVDNDGYVTLWDARRHLMVRNVCIMNGDRHGALKACGDILSVRSDNIIHVYGVSSDGTEVVKRSTLSLSTAPISMLIVGTNILCGVLDGISFWDAMTGVQVGMVAMPSPVRSLGTVGDGSVWALSDRSVFTLEGMAVVSQDVVAPQEGDGMTTRLVPLYKLEMDVVWHVAVSAAEPICTVLTTERLTRPTPHYPPSPPLVTTSVTPQAVAPPPPLAKTFCDAEAQCTLAIHSDADVTSLLREAQRLSATKDITIDRLKEEMREMTAMQGCLEASERQIALLTASIRDMNDLLDVYRKHESASPTVSVTVPKEKAPPTAPAPKVGPARTKIIGTNSNMSKIPRNLSSLHGCVEELWRLTNTVSSVDTADLQHYIHTIRNLVGSLLIQYRQHS